MVFDPLDRRALTPVVVHQILVVEDDPDTSQFLKELLQRNGYEVTLAKDGGQAHSSFVMRKPDFVILDLILPGEETGYEVCERFKQTEKAVPVLVLSAIELPESLDLAQRVGCDGYLTKPFEPAVLLSRITEVADEVWARTHNQVQKVDGEVRFACRCGKKFKVSPSHRGKTLSCPKCGEILAVPRHD